MRTCLIVFAVAAFCSRIALSTEWSPQAPYWSPQAPYCPPALARQMPAKDSTKAEDKTVRRPEDPRQLPAKDSAMALAKDQKVRIEYMEWQLANDEQKAVESIEEAIRQLPDGSRLERTRRDRHSIGVRHTSAVEQLFGHRRATRKETLMSEKKAPGKLARAKGTQKSTKRTTKQTAKKVAVSPGRRADKADGESAVLTQIAAMLEPDRALGERLHAIIKASAPALSPRLWYGMPAYARDGKVVCFFQSAQKFKTRYATFGFMHEANLDEGAMWPTAFALKELTAAEEARIGALVKKAVS